MHLVDEFQANARASIYAAFKKGYGQYGIRTVWLDGSEPERSTSYNFGKVRFAAGTDSEIGEAWIQQHLRAISEGFAADGFAPDEFFLLPRSAWAGTSRFSAGVWSGDVESSFAELALQVRVLQQMALSGHALWTNDGGGYSGGDPANPVFQELIVRWLQASTFFPIMRLHGQRKGGPPADECGETGGSNEPWNLATDPEHYAAIAAAMTLREDLVDYTLALNRETVRSGLPMARPMVLAFPGDAACAGEDVADQWMYGKDWLVGPVLAYQAQSRSVYLPALENATWVYYMNGTDAGAGGYRVTVDTTRMADFPLFLRTPTPPPAPRLKLATLWSAERADVVTCASAQCYADQTADGAYVPLFAEGEALSSGAAVVIGGASFAATALTDYWSAGRSDNACGVAGPPDAGYDSTVIANGFVLAQQAPGTQPLLQFFRNYSGNATGHVDRAAFASAAGIAWAGAHGYTLEATLGYVFA